MIIKNSITQSNNSNSNLYDMFDDDMNEDIFSQQNKSQNVEIEKSEIEEYFIKKSLAHWMIYIQYYDIIFF